MITPQENMAYSGDAPDFITELGELLNRRSMENGSDTPNFILAQYLTDCLQAWNRATKRREDWYGRTLQEVSASSIREKVENERWLFIADWCKKKGISPMTADNFNRAAMEWVKLNCFESSTPAQVG